MDVSVDRRIVAALCGLMAVVSCAWFAISASAQLPEVATGKIINFQSIGGVGLGTSQSKLFSLWGNPGSSGCYHPTTPGYPDQICTWFPQRTNDLPPEGGYAEIDGGKVCEVAIQAGYEPGDYTLHTTKLRKQKWHTPDGVGLGSSKSAAKQAFPGTRGSGDVLQGDKHAVRETISLMFTGPDKGDVQTIDLLEKGSGCFKYGRPA
jgi:hypothetical protein